MLSLDAAQVLLEPYRKPVFVEPIKLAVTTWHDFVRESPEKALPMDATARANMIHCWWESNVRAEMQEQSGIREIEAMQFFTVAVGENPIVRFKLLYRDQSSNIKTEQQKLLAMQRYKDEAMESLALEGVPAPPTNLTCGYVLDDLAELVRVELRCEYDNRIVWRWKLWSEEGGEGDGTFEQPPLPIGPQPRPAVVRSARKQTDSNEKSSDSPQDTS